MGLDPKSAFIPNSLILKTQIGGDKRGCEHADDKGWRTSLEGKNIYPEPWGNGPQVHSLSNNLIWEQRVMEERVLGWESGDTGSNPALAICL